MTNRELDARISECSVMISRVCADLQLTDPNIEQAVAFGALSACALILANLSDTLAGEDTDNAAQQLLLSLIGKVGNT